MLVQDGSPVARVSEVHADFLKLDTSMGPAIEWGHRGRCQGGRKTVEERRSHGEPAGSSLVLSLGTHQEDLIKKNRQDDTIQHWWSRCGWLGSKVKTRVRTSIGANLAYVHSSRTQAWCIVHLSHHGHICITAANTSHPSFSITVLMSERTGVRSMVRLGSFSSWWANDRSCLLQTFLLSLLISTSSRGGAECRYRPRGHAYTWMTNQ